MKTVLITGVGVLTPRSVASMIYEKPFLFVRDTDAQPIVLKSEVEDDSAHIRWGDWKSASIMFLLPQLEGTA